MAAMVREEGTFGRSRKSRVQTGVYVNWNTFQKHIRLLAEQKLISGDGLQVTERGKRFLEDYQRRVRPALEEYGFVASAQRRP